MCFAQVNVRSCTYTSVQVVWLSYCLQFLNNYSLNGLAPYVSPSDVFAFCSYDDFENFNCLLLFLAALESAMSALESFYSFFLIPPFKTCLGMIPNTLYNTSLKFHPLKIGTKTTALQFQ